MKGGGPEGDTWNIEDLIRSEGQIALAELAEETVAARWDERMFAATQVVVQGNMMRTML